MTVIALLSPGAMGASVGAAAVSNGHQVLWHDHGRSEETRSRAKRAKLESVESEKELYTRAEIILSICPPHVANDIAEGALKNSFKGTFVEANAISPSRMRSIDAELGQADIICVDGGIIGGPAWSSETNTQLYTSGHKAREISDLFNGSPLHASVVDDRIGSASALKMTFAAFSKGTTALLTAILAVAEKEGIRDSLQSQWGDAFSEQTAARVTGNTAKAWRFQGEMLEIARTFSEAGLPGGFHEAAADIFGRLAQYKDLPEPPPLQELLSKLTPL